jgi:hypothetical protein
VNVAYAAIVEGMEEKERVAFDAKLDQIDDEWRGTRRYPAGVVDPRRIAPNQLDQAIAMMRSLS